MTEAIEQIEQLKNELNVILESLIKTEKSLANTTLIQKYTTPTKKLSNEEILEIEKKYLLEFPISFKEFISSIGFGCAYRDGSHLDFSYFPCFLTNYAVKTLFERNISIEEIENVEFDFFSKSFNNYNIQEIYSNDSNKELFVIYSLELAHGDILILNGIDKGKISWEGEPEYRKIELNGKQIRIISYKVFYDNIQDDAISSYLNAIESIKQDLKELKNKKVIKDLINKYNYY